MNSKEEFLDLYKKISMYNHYKYNLMWVLGTGTGSFDVDMYTYIYQTITKSYPDVTKLFYYDNFCRYHEDAFKVTSADIKQYIITRMRGIEVIELALKELQEAETKDDLLPPLHLFVVFSLLKKQSQKQCGSTN
jgi:hypothetical protein